MMKSTEDGIMHMPDQAGRRGRALWLAVAAGAMAAGCATTGSDPYFSRVKSDASVYVAPVRTDVAKVAVLPFKAPTELIGSSVSDIVVTELLRAARYTLVERSQMASVLGETELAMAGLSESKAVEVAKMLGADGVVIGTVDEYAMQAQGGKTLPVVGLSIRLIHTQSGQILWSGNLAKMAENPKTPLAGHGRAVVHELIAGIYQKWGVQKTGKPAGSSDNPRAAVPVVTMPAEPPSAPDSVSASDLGLREVALKWTPPAVAVPVFRIERSESEDGPFTTIAEVSPMKREYRDTGGLKDATTYYYRLIAVDAAKRTSEPSRVIESMTAPPPDPPLSLSAQATGSRAVTLSWTAPRVEGVTRYCIERAKASAPDEWKPIAEVASVSHVDGGKPGTDLEDSADYLYRLTSINRVDARGPPSDPVPVTTLPPPVAVEGLSALSEQVRCVPLAWTPSPEPDVAGYEIERSDASASEFAPLTQIKGRTTVAHLDGRRDPGDLLDQTTYSYRIRPFNGVGSVGEWSDPVSATTRPPPPAPAAVLAKGDLPRAVEVQWEASPDDKVTGYDIQRAIGAEGDFVQMAKLHGRETVMYLDRAGASRSAPVGRLKDGSLYRYRVRAINTAGAVSDWSVEAAATTKPAPIVPAGLKATVDRPAAVNLEWVANPEPDISSYTVEARAAGSSRWREVASVASTNAEHGGLGPGTEHVYRIKAVAADTLESAWSEEAPGRARPLPDAPSDVKVEWTADGAKLSWTPPRDGMSEFRIYEKGFFSSSKIQSAPGPDTVLGAGRVGKKIVVTVTAVDEEGLESSPSAPLEIRPPPAP